GGRDGFHVHGAVRAELDDPVDRRPQSEVAPAPDVLAGVELRADLAHEDGAGRHVLARVGLHPAELRVAVAAVAAGALTFLVSHGVLIGRDRVLSWERSRPRSARDHGVDADVREVLAVALLAPVALAPADLEDDQL